MSNEYGITSTGFNPKPVDVIEDDFKELLKQFFGQNVDLTQQSPLWKMMQVPATEISQLWLVAEQNFYACFIQTAEGSALDLLGEDIGLERKNAVNSVVELKIYKNTSSLVTVPSGSLFETAEGIVFSTDEEITIPAGDPTTEIGVVMATAVESGESGNVPADTITIPSNPITGVERSNNDNAAFGGEEIETDNAYRKRLRSYVRATWTRDAIRSAALNVDGVSGVKIIEHATSYDCLIVPQTIFTPELKAAVEQAIEKVTPITVEYNVLEAEGILINITADVTLESLYDESTAEADSEIEIREYLERLNIDDDVLKSRIIQAIMNVVGIINAYNVVVSGRAWEEKHTYTTGTLTYELNYANGNAEYKAVEGTLSGSAHTFVAGVDYNFATSPARIIWTGTGDLPDDGTEFKATYDIPANAIGDIEIRQQNIAKFGEIDLTKV